MKRMTKYEKYAKLLGNVYAWCEFMDFDELTITLADIAERIGMSKSTARRLAQSMSEELPGVSLRNSEFLGKLVLTISVPEQYHVDSALQPHFQRAHLAETIRLYRLYGEPVRATQQESMHSVRKEGGAS